ncbi:MAG: Glu-tRNA(Gln) amidotransferase subunit GatE [Candidatus Micrarchaeota archaeon]|nr:Glu-tRNA(Gln) amidotransferase subunit GatE [Candidatus Micrarchaeota archaeon]
MPKIGLEIHQRLKGKLFCRCKYDEQPFRHEIRRRFTISRSEVGDIDLAAKLEIEKNKDILYRWNNSHACLVELDEEPPLSPDPKSLETASSIARSFNMTIFPKAMFMRKIVVDGSNTSGFQRTALVAIDGKIETSKGPIGIQTLCVEEESAAILEESPHYRAYGLNRLGITLLEIATTPDIKDGEHAKEVAQKIGLTLRMHPYVERGLGTIRQDLNISVEGGARVEIKGAQELDMIPAWVENEIQRQKDLIALIQELKEKNLFNIPEEIIEITEHLRGAGGFVGKAIERGERAFALRFPGYKGVFARKVGKRRYGSELADYARLAGVKGLIHSDEASKYNIDLSNVLGDGWVFVIAPLEQAKKALSYVLYRAKMDYVPEETRKALPDGSSQFMRPLPGAARMYPETDIEIFEMPEAPPVPTMEEKLQELKQDLNEELARRMLTNHRLYLYEELKEKVEPKIVAVTLEDTLISLRRETGKEPTDDQIRKVLLLYAQGKLTKRGIKEALKRLMEKKPIDDLYKFPKEKVEELKKELPPKEIIKRYPFNVEPSELF